MRVLAYLLAFVLSGVIGPLTMLVTLPVLMLAGLFRNRLWLDINQGWWWACAAFTSAASSTMAFHWLGQRPSILCPLLIWVGYVLNGVYRVRKAGINPVVPLPERVTGERRGEIAGLIGVIIGGGNGVVGAISLAHSMEPPSPPSFW